MARVGIKYKSIFVIISQFPSMLLRGHHIFTTLVSAVFACMYVLVCVNVLTVSEQIRQMAENTRPTKDKLESQKKNFNGTHFVNILYFTFCIKCIQMHCSRISCF